MSQFERIVDVEHAIGEAGSLRLRGIDGPVSLRGVDGDTVRVRVIYQVRAASEAAADRAIADAQVRLDRGPDRLELDARDRRWGPLDAVAWLFGEGHVRVGFEAEVPRGASVRVETVSGHVEADGLVGDQRYTTVSAPLDLDAVSGRVEADTVSGRIDVAGDTDLALRSHSVSGGVRASAPHLLDVRLTTTSGSIVLEGTLAPGVEHRVETVSGSLRLGAPGSVTIDMRTISGSVRADPEARVETLGGGRRVVLGDGSARLRFQSMSGSLDVSGSAWQGFSAGARAGWQAGGRGGRDRSTQAEPTVASQPGAAPRPEAASQPEAAAGSPSAPGQTEATGPSRDAQLDILRALERGEIGVDEASDRLAMVGRPQEMQHA